MTNLPLAAWCWAITLFAAQILVLALVARWAVRKGIEDASESLRADLRAVLDEMQRRRKREALDNQGDR